MALLRGRTDVKVPPSVVAVAGVALAFWLGFTAAHDQDQRAFAEFIDGRVNADVDKMCAAIYQATLDEEAADTRLRYAISGNRPRALPLLQQEFPLCLFDQVIVSGGRTLVPTVRYPLTLDAVK